MNDVKNMPVRTVDSIEAFFPAVERSKYLKWIEAIIQTHLDQAWLAASVSSFETAMEKLQISKNIQPYYADAFSLLKQKGRLFYGRLARLVVASICGEDTDPQIDYYIRETLKGEYLQGFVRGLAIGYLGSSLGSVRALSQDAHIPLGIALILIDVPGYLYSLYENLLALHMEAPEINTVKAISEEVDRLAFAPRTGQEAWMDVPMPDNEKEGWTVVVGGEKIKGTALTVACAFAGSNLEYPYRSDGHHTVGSFEEVLEALYDKPLLFNIRGYENHYAEQEQKLLATVREKLLEHDPCLQRF